MIIGLGLPLIFIPITAASYFGLRPNQTDMASALLNAARNTGGSIGVSIASNVLARREPFHQARLSEAAIPSSVPYRETVNQVTQYFSAAGSGAGAAHGRAVGWIGQQIQAQASPMGFIDVFWVLMMMALATIPLALILRNVKLGGAAPAGH